MSKKEQKRQIPYHKIYLPPVDHDLPELLDRLITSLPSYADGSAYIEDEEIWRPVRRSRKKNYYTKKSWKPLLGWNYILLARKLMEHINFLKYQYCVHCAFLITKDKKLYIASVYQPEWGSYILYPKAEIGLVCVKSKE